MCEVLHADWTVKKLTHFCLDKSDWKIISMIYYYTMWSLLSVDDEVKYSKVLCIH